MGQAHGKIETKGGITLNWSCLGVSNVDIIESTWHPEFEILF